MSHKTEHLVSILAALDFRTRLQKCKKCIGDGQEEPQSQNIVKRNNKQTKTCNTINVKKIAFGNKEHTTD